MSPIERRRFLGGALALAAGGALVSSCSSDGGAPATTTGATPTRKPADVPIGSIDGSAVPGQAEVERWMRQIVERGIRRPGYPADEWTEAFAAEQLREAGLEVRLEPVPVQRWEPGPARLEVALADGATRSIPCFPVPYATATSGLTVELAVFDPDDPTSAEGRAALVDARVVRLAPDALVGAGSAPEDLTGRLYDPDGTFADDEHVLPHTAERRRVLDPVIAAGAAAFIGALVDYPGGGHEYYVPYDGVARPIPGVWISGGDGAWLRDQLAAGPVRVTLAVEAATTAATSQNVIGELAGADDDLVIVGSHHDGPWASAVEDASGTALVLAQARYWAAQPADRRPHRMVFVLHAGHMCGSAGLDAYLAEHVDQLPRTVLEVHLEHAALEAEERDGRLVATDRCTPRWFFTSRLDRLEGAVAEAIVAEDLRRSMILAPDALGESPPTDGGRYHQHGVPLVQFLAAPSYLFDPADTIDKVDLDALLPLTRATIRIIESTRGVSADAMRTP